MSTIADEIKLEKNKEDLVTETQHVIETSSSHTPSVSPVNSKQDHTVDLELAPEDPNSPELVDPHSFSPLRKNIIVFILSLSLFLSPMSSMCLLPAVPTIAAHFKTTGNIINLSISVYNILMAASPCLLNPLCNIFGRRITFISFLSLFLIASILTAVSQNLAMFFVFRGASALFGTTLFGVSALIIGDIFRPTERGTAQGWTLLGSQVGVSVGPVIGGIVTTYTSWRWIFWVQSLLILTNLILVFCFISETMRKTEEQKKEKIKYNPFKIFYCFKYKNLVLAGIIASAITFGASNILVPISYVMNPRFNLTSPLLSSLFFLPTGMGYVCGAMIGGRYADYTVKKYIKKRGKRIAEDRLYSTIIGFSFLLPVTNLIYGWCLEKGKGGIAVPVIALFFNGVGQTLCYSSSNTYCIDCMPPELKSESIGGNYFIRFCFSAVGAAIVLTEIEHIGVGWTSTVSAGFFMFGSCCLFVLIKYGKNFRPNTEKNEID
ncbi:hypothetical protein WICPIJ_002989 [Wickerhamomyces pijperi]|uniref:Major facilitator superfamily (MFS) profile domain-containing protein n=1 Tax=Wickerhamomyces pijperi TaxID=599730 RepID=A0A9P8QAK9_WICPI|nr:hypothetical protein WICPIJ_002989 [Wickerhamomyces pijperi]